MYIELEREIIDEIDLKSYLKEKKIQLPDYRVAVIALILDKDGRILLQRRGPKSRDEIGKLEDIGGACEKGDKSFRESMHREIVEEVGEDIKYTIDELVDACLVKKYDTRSDSYVNWLFFLYKCTYIDGELKINEPGKCLGYEFYHYDELPINDIAKTTFDFWEYYYNKKNAE